MTFSAFSEKILGKIHWMNISVIYIESVWSKIEWFSQEDYIKKKTEENITKREKISWKNKDKRKIVWIFYWSFTYDFMFSLFNQNSYK